MIYTCLHMCSYVFAKSSKVVNILLLKCRGVLGLCYGVATVGDFLGVWMFAR